MFKRSASQTRNDSEDGTTVDSDNNNRNNNNNNQQTGAYNRSNTPNLSSRQKASATIRPVQVSVYNYHLVCEK